MSKKLLALGSNIEPRKEYLEKTLVELSSYCEIIKVSPFYETAPLLTEDAPESWRQPFLNGVIEIKSSLGPHDFLDHIKTIEKKIGTRAQQKWAPRCVDIDILQWDDIQLDDDQLSIPHPQIKRRAFVMGPLKDLDPTFIKKARLHPAHSPLWMSIINGTPDSFSGGASWQSMEEFGELIRGQEKLGVHILDLGAESTRPGAESLSVEEEWQRLKPCLLKVKELQRDQKIFPLISIDSRKPAVISRALEYGIDIINDVGGLEDTEMLDLLKDTDATYVLMHSLGAPADPKKVLEAEPVGAICQWLEEKINELEKNNIKLDRVIVDPGIGFGKSPKQSIEILKHIEVFKDYPFRLMVGHSRKSFMKSFSHQDPGERDFETLGVSMRLIEKGVDILRVHNPEIHIRAARGWNHVTG